MSSFYKFIFLLLLPIYANAQIFSQYIETEVGSQPKVLELYNNSGSIIYMGNDNVRIYYAANTNTTETLLTSIQSGQWKPGQVLIVGPLSTTSQGGSSDDESLGKIGAQIQALMTERNPNHIYKERNMYFNGDDHLRLVLYNVASETETTYDTFGRGPLGHKEVAAYNTVRSKDQNLQRKPGLNIGDPDWWAETQTNADNISVEWEIVFNGYNETDGDMVVTSTDANSNGVCDNLETVMQGFGIPPVGFLSGNGDIYTWDDTNKKVVNNISGDASYSADAEPTASTIKPLYVAKGGLFLLNNGLQFPSIEVASGASLTIGSGNDVTLDDSLDSDSYNAGDFVNNGTVTMNSTSTAFSSLIIKGDATGNITYNRWVNNVSSSSPSDANPGWDLVGSPVLNGTLDPTTLATSGVNYGILPFDNTSSSNGSWTNTTSNATFTTSTGVGYAMAKTTAGTVAFTGVPNTFTNTNIAITNNTSGSGTHWNLVANPFPAFLALNGDALSSSATSSFLWYNGTNVDVLGHNDFAEGIWYWDGTDYIAKNNSTSGILYAVPGQAFFISAESSGNVAFRTGNITTQASLNNGDDFIAGDEFDEDKAEIHISAMQNLVGNSTEIYFNEFGSDGLDKGYDTQSFPSSVNRIHSRLVENDPGVNLAIQTLSFSEMWDKTIPIGINANSGEELTISISYRTTPADLKLYLEDTELNTLTNLVEEDYVLIPQMDIQGVGRYFIHTSAETMGSEEVSTSLLNVYNEVNTNFIIIEGLATQSSNTTVNLYNILGGKVLETVLNNSNNIHRLSIDSLSKGIYIIELQSDNDRLTKKLLIQ